MNGNEPNEVQKWRLRFEIRYLIMFFAICHSLYILHLITNNETPTPHTDDGYIQMCLLYLATNLYLYDSSKIYKYCFWHRQPIIFNIYYEASRLLWAKDIIKWNVTTWNTVDGWVLFICFTSWIIGYSIHVYLVPFIRNIYEYIKIKNSIKHSN